MREALVQKITAEQRLHLRTLLRRWNLSLRTRERLVMVKAVALGQLWQLSLLGGWPKSRVGACAPTALANCVVSMRRAYRSLDAAVGASLASSSGGTLTGDNKPMR
jgi:hypothetical protein